MAGRNRRRLGLERVEGRVVRVVVDAASMLGPNSLVNIEGVYVRVVGFEGSTRAGDSIWSCMEVAP